VPWSNTIPLEANTRNAKNAAEVHVDGEAGRDEGGPAGREKKKKGFVAAGKNLSPGGAERGVQ
jgi:hypothetical protein